MGLKLLKKVPIGLLASALVIGNLSMTAFASAKQISSVSIKISSNIEAGDSLGSIQLSTDSSEKAENGETIVIVTENDKYYATEAEWVTKNDKDEDLEVGDTPKLKVTLTLVDSDNYKWKGSYSSSNIHISNGTYYKSNKSGDELEVTIKLKELKGVYASPEDAYWKGHVAKWSAPDSNASKNYEVRLKRGNSTVKTVKTTSTSYNFSKDFTRTGEYTFEVRSIAPEDGKGTKSEWVESDVIEIDKKDVNSSSSSSSGSSSPNIYNTSSSSGGPFSPISYNNNTAQGTTSGPMSPIASSWKRLNGYWYFIENTISATGWKNVDGNWYYFDPTTGVMQTGWRLIDNKWYYFTVEDTSDQGKMYHDRWLTIGDKDYYLGSSGAMLEGWQLINGEWYYLYPGSGHKAVNTTIDGYIINPYGVWKGGY